jgi:hypothetical protein
MSRPPFKPTQENFQMVEVLTYAGWHQTRIAQVIGIDPKTLRKHFRDQLDHGAVRCYQKLVTAVRLQAHRGSARSLKLLRSIGLELE